MDESVIRIEDIVNILKRRWKMIIAITSIATIFSAVMSFYVIAPKYEASAKLFIGKENNVDVKYSDNDVQMYQKLLKTYAEVITTNDLVDRAINKNDLDVSSSEVLKALTVSPRSDTQILELKYVNNDNVLAKEVLDSITDEFVNTASELIPNGQVKIVEKVKTPTKAVSPNKKMNIAIAFLVGLMISAGLSFLLEFLNNTIKTKETLEGILELPVLGTIPDEII